MALEMAPNWDRVIGEIRIGNMNYEREEDMNASFKASGG